VTLASVGFTSVDITVEDMQCDSNPKLFLYPFSYSWHMYTFCFPLNPHLIFVWSCCYVGFEGVRAHKTVKKHQFPTSSRAVAENQVWPSY